MPSTSMADFMTDWDALLKRVTANGAELPDLSAYSAPLAQILEAAKEGIAAADGHRGVKQETTKTLKGLLTQGSLAAAKLRAAVKAHYGRDSERLVEFKMRPSGPKSVSRPLRRPWNRRHRRQPRRRPLQTKSRRRRTRLRLPTLRRLRNSRKPFGEGVRQHALSFQRLSA